MKNRTVVASGRVTYPWNKLVSRIEWLSNAWPGFHIIIESGTSLKCTKRATFVSGKYSRGNPNLSSIIVIRSGHRNDIARDVFTWRGYPFCLRTVYEFVICIEIIMCFDCMPFDYSKSTFSSSDIQKFIAWVARVWEIPSELFVDGPPVFYPRIPSPCQCSQIYCV